MRLSKLLLLLIFIPNLVFAGGDYYKGASANFCDSGSPATIFYWNCIDTDASDNVCVTSGGDSSASSNGEVSLTGTLNLIDTSNNGADFYQFDVAAYDLWPQGAFTIEMKINLTVITGGARLFVVKDAAVDDYTYAQINAAAGNDIQLVRAENGGGTVNVTFDTNISTSTTYYIVIRCSASDGPDLWLSTTKWPDVDTGGSWDEQADVLGNFNNTPTILDIGNSGSADNLEGTIVEIRIYNGWKTY